MEASKPPQPFTIVSQTHTKGFRSDGTYGGIWTITAEASGTQFSVDVPDEDYNAQTVGQLVANKAATIAAVNTLGTAT